MESSYQKFTKEVIVIGIMTLMVTLSDIILLPLLTKTLGAQDYGIWSQVQATVGLMVPLAALGLPFAMVRFLTAEKDKKEIQEGFYSIVAIVVFNNLIISSILIIFPGFIADHFFEGASQVVRITGLLTLAFALNGAYLAFFRTFRRIKTYAVFNVVRAYAEIGLISCLVLSGHGILAAVVGLLIIRVALFLGLFFFIGSEIGVRKPDFSRIREYLNFSLPTVAGNITSWVVSLSDRYVIAYFLGAASVGIYSAGYVIANGSMLFAGILGLLLPAALSQLYDEGRIDEVKTHLRYSLKYMLALGIPFVFGAAILAEPVLRMMSTAEIASEGRWVIPIVAFGFLLISAAYAPGHILILAKKTKISAAAMGISALVNLSLNILIVPHVGILGAAITTAIAYFLLLGIVSYYTFKEFRFNIEWRFIVKSLIASAIMSLVIWWISPVTNVATIITVVVGVVVYGAALFLLRGFSQEELKFFRGLFNRAHLG